MFSWGKASSGQLGIGSTEENAIRTPQEVCLSNNASTNVTAIASGDEHTALTTDDGVVYTCGGTDFGQTGRETTTTKFGPVPGLEILSFKLVACGSHHTLALTREGTVYSWGDGRDGQLGRNLKNQEDFSKTPRLVKGFSSTVVLISCGNKHCLALTALGTVYSWGSNSYSQLGNGIGPNVEKPQQIMALAGVPIAQVTAGGYHSVARTISGNLCSWGKNDFGQLGLGDTTTRTVPAWIQARRNLCTCYVCCGSDHTAFVTKISGKLFTFGSNGNGQLGHTSGHSYVPKQVSELMGESVIQVACGRQHTIALTSKSRLYAFGLNGSGQLGVKSSVKGDPAIVSNLNEPLRCIFAGGDQSFALLSSGRFLQSNFQPRNPEFSPNFISEQFLNSAINDAEETKQYNKLANLVATAFETWSLLNGSFINTTNFFNKWWSSLNIESVRTISSRLASIDDAVFCNKFSSAIHAGIKPWIKDGNAPSAASEEFFRAFIILPECHFFRMPNKHIEIILSYARALLTLSNEQRKIIEEGYIGLGSKYFYVIVKAFMGLLSHILMPLKNRLVHEALASFPGCMNLWECLRVLSFLNETNEAGNEMISYESFYLKELNESKEFNLLQDYLRLIGVEKRPALFSFPYLFDSHMKSKLLDIDARFQMQRAMDSAHHHNIGALTGVRPNFMTEPHLVFRIRRSRLLHDTLDEVAKYSAQQEQSGEPVFKKPLLVQFDNEEGQDVGGVKKEFFLFLVRDLFHPDFGMFTVLSESNVTWIFEQSYELQLYELVGIICGLAIYNNVILKTNFPLVIYKKLLNRSLNLNDLKELYPSLAENLQAMLDYDKDDFDDVFDLTFQIDRLVFGQTVTFDLVPGGAQKIVTKENRHEYVNHYVNFLLNKAVENQFNAFSKGFWRVCSRLCCVSGRTAMFHPKELMSIASGCLSFDLMDMKGVTEYRNGYHDMHRTVVWFWDILKNFGDTLRKKFLVFLTGSDRIPITGIKSMRFFIQRCDCGPNYNRLPVAHTCFNVLDLPDYGSHPTLRDKLIFSITQTSGFGLV